MEQLHFWLAEGIPKKIIFHNDFDGICSAALLGRYFSTDIDLEPVRYSVKGKWLNMKLAQTAVVDFLFHPDALWWFDHHETSFLNEELKQKYRPNARHRWDITYLSCPPLILDTLSEFNDVTELKESFQEWLVWADIIDSAHYKSPHQAVLGEEPCILLNQALAESNSADLRIKLVREIISGASPDDLANSQQIVTYWRSFREQQLIALNMMESRLRRIGCIGYCDLTDVLIPFVRYGVYFIAPEVLYSVIGYKSRMGISSFQISLSANPWLNNLADINLGILAQKYGGGGRKTVGSIPAENSVKYKDIIDKLLQELSNSVSVKVHYKEAQQ